MEMMKNLAVHTTLEDILKDLVFCRVEEGSKRPSQYKLYVSLQKDTVIGGVDIDIR